MRKIATVFLLVVILLVVANIALPAFQQGDAGAVQSLDLETLSTGAVVQLNNNIETRWQYNAGSCNDFVYPQGWGGACWDVSKSGRFFFGSLIIGTSGPEWHDKQRCPQPDAVDCVEMYTP